jgi:hypothetical protein
VTTHCGAPVTGPGHRSAFPPAIPTAPLAVPTPGARSVPLVNRLLAFAASAAATATAQTYFVAPDGTDTTGSCTANTASNAFPTIQDALACAVNGDQVSVPAGLLPLANNGGPTNTAALAPSSAATAAASATTCEQAPINETDQRGHSRNATTRGGCDIGAYDTGGAS